jgi:hypothetical protein
MIAGLAGPAQGGLVAAERAGRIEVHDGGRLVLAWQVAPLANPAGGDRFHASAFLHPLCTPGGFGLTQIQPADHLHHFGVWWPWKFLEVDGRRHNTWELQQNEGRQVAVSARIGSQSPDEVMLELVNRHEVRIGDAYLPAVDERTRMVVGRQGKDAYQIDLLIDQQPVAGRGIKVVAYRYSGFSWRGTAAWDKSNSRMQTSEGRDRDHANHQPARWVMVGGKTPAGAATMLVLSAAAKNGGKPELLRVWDSKTQSGTPFLNFNPVVAESLPLDGTRGEVSRRRYRLVMADRAIEPAEAERFWQDWR